MLNKSNTNARILFLRPKQNFSSDLLRRNHQCIAEINQTNLLREEFLFPEKDLNTSQRAGLRNLIKSLQELKEKTNSNTEQE